MPDSIAELRDRFLRWKFGMFIHFNVATFNACEWATGYEDPATFNPDMLDCTQWAEAAVSAGMQYMVLTVKHTGGWCLWNSQTTATHAMSAFQNYKDGQGDLLSEYVQACRAHHLNVGLYYCFPRDFRSPEGKKTLRGLPPEANVNPLAFVKKQLTELLTNYGQIDLLWCDQFQFDLYEHWQDITAHIKHLQPQCLIVANNSLDLSETDICSYEYPWLIAKERQPLPDEGNRLASEVCDKMGHGWFWKQDDEINDLKSTEDVLKMVEVCNSRNANYLINVAPDMSGLIPEYSVRRLREIGSHVRNFS